MGTLYTDRLATRPFTCSNQVSYFFNLLRHNLKAKPRIKMSEAHFDKYEHYNYEGDQDKAMFSGHSGKQRSKKEAAQNTNHHNPGGHERKISTKLQNAEKNNQARPSVSK